MNNFAKDFMKELSSSAEYNFKTKGTTHEGIDIDDVQDAISAAFDTIDFTMTPVKNEVNKKALLGETRDSFILKYKGNDIEIEHHRKRIMGEFTYSINGGKKEILAKGHKYQNSDVMPQDFNTGIKKLIDKMKKM